MNARIILGELFSAANKEIAEHSSRFFKTGPGEYGEGDQFLGIRVPEQRKIARKYHNLPLDEVQTLLESKYHEVRLTGLFVLVYKYKKADTHRKEQIYQFYLTHLDHVNNWDLVDSSAKYIAGHYLFDKDRNILFELAKSKNLWNRRIAILTTFYFIDRNDFSTTLEISDLLFHDNEDLIHKAVGWMLREVGKKDKPVLVNYLNPRYKSMTRTMLRYALEKFSTEERKSYLQAKI